MAIIDCVQWAPQGSETTFAWRYPETNLSTATNLLVHESQVALLFSKGQLMGKFGPGRHVLSTENLPILRSLYGIPFGGKNPFMAEVWFVNMTQPYNIDWTATRLTIHDADYNTMLPLRAGGQYGLKVQDPEKFLIKVVGTRQRFTQHDMTEQFTGEFNTKAKSIILQYMLNNRIGFKQIQAHLDVMSENLRGLMADFWSELGLQLTKFYVSDIDIDDSTDDGRRVKAALAQQSTMSITGHSWQQEQMFNTANRALGAMQGMGGGSGQGGLLGGLMAINMMNSMTQGGGGAVGGQMMNPQYNQPTFSPGQGGGGQGGYGQQGGYGGGGQGGYGQQGRQQGPRTVWCASCSRKFTDDKAYCPHCGKKYNPCPSCGSDNADDARRCISCGTRFQGGAAAGGQPCPRCGAIVPAGAQFCSNCGSAVGAGADDTRCSRCGTPMAPNEKFCPRCGNRR